MKLDMKKDFLIRKGITFKKSANTDDINNLFVEYLREEMTKLVGEKIVPQCYGKSYDSKSKDCKKCYDNKYCKKEFITPKVREGDAIECYGKFKKKSAKCNSCKGSYDCIVETTRENKEKIDNELKKGKKMVKKVKNETRSKATEPVKKKSATEPVTEKVTRTKSGTSRSMTVEKIETKDKKKEKKATKPEKKATKKPDRKATKKPERKEKKAPEKKETKKPEKKEKKKTDNTLITGRAKWAVILDKMKEYSPKTEEQRLSIAERAQKELKEKNIVTYRDDCMENNNKKWAKRYAKYEKQEFKKYWKDTE